MLGYELCIERSTNLKQTLAMVITHKNSWFDLLEMALINSTSFSLQDWWDISVRIHVMHSSWKKHLVKLQRVTIGSLLHFTVALLWSQNFHFHFLWSAFSCKASMLFIFSDLSRVQNNQASQLFFKLRAHLQIWFSWQDNSYYQNRSFSGISNDSNNRTQE